MPPKKDPDTTPGVKLLRMFRKLMLDGRRHFQSDLAEEFQCSPQTIIRLAGELEAVVGAGKPPPLVPDSLNFAKPPRIGV